MQLSEHLKYTTWRLFFASIGVMLCMCGQLYAQIPTSGLVAYYPFNGNAIDASGNGHNGATFGVYAAMDRFGNPNGAFGFSNTVSFVQVNGLPTMNGAHAYSAWIKVSGGGNFGCVGTLDSANGTWDMTYDVGTHVLWVYDRTNDALGTSVDLGAGWNHIAVVYTNDTRLVYINGDLRNLQSITTPIATSPTDILRIGRHTLNVQQFSGYIDDVRIYNRALSSQEILALDAEQPSAGLVAYYPLNGNATDASGNANNGTLNNVVATSGRFGQSNTACLFGGFYNPGSIVVPNSASLQFSTSATFSTWIKLTSTAGNDSYGNYSANGAMTLWAKDAEGSGAVGIIDFQDTTRVRFDLGGVAISRADTMPWVPRSSFSANQWNHVVWVLQANQYAVYLNGSLVARHNATITFSTMNSRALLFGRFSDNWTPLNGAMDEARVYKRALSDSEVSALYHENGGPSIGPIAYFPFTGNAADSSLHGNDCTVNGATLTTDRFGRLNSAYQFNGSTSFIGTTNPTSLPISNDPRSVSLWVFEDGPNATQKTQCVVFWGTTYSTGESFGLEVEGNPLSPKPRIPYFVGWGQDMLGNTTLNLGQWYHLVMTYDGTTGNIYLNNVLDASSALALNTVLNADGLMIGKISPNGGNHSFFNGRIDDVRIYNRVIDTSEISALYHQGGWPNVTSAREGTSGVPALYSLGQNYPNPFNPSTTISYALPARSHVTLSVFNVLGQKVADLVDAEKEAGSHTAMFDGTRLTSGVYFYRIQAGSFIEAKKLVLTK